MATATNPLESGLAARDRLRQMRRSAMRMCHSPEGTDLSLLRALSAKEWQNLLRWMDYAGLALYFFHRVCEEHLDRVLPPEVFVRLRRNLLDNQQRTAAMLGELAEIVASFDAGGLSFAVLKGVTLWPHSCAEPWLRSQADTDFLIAAKDVAQARLRLEARGFYLHAVSGRSWEFRAGKIHTATLENMYRPVSFRSVELHVETEVSPRGPLLERCERLLYGEIEIPALSAADLFVGQALHLYKHVCDEFFRASHVLELHRHMLARRDDRGFWEGLRAMADRGAAVPVKLGVVTLLATRLLGAAAPECFLEWTVERLPPAARLWVERYGERAALGEPPGTKLYLLLQHALDPSGVARRRGRLRALVPSGLPPFAGKLPGEGLRDRLRRYRLHLRLLRCRLRFHVVEGFRYFAALPSWSRELARLEARQPDSAAFQQRSDNPLTHV